MRRLGLRVVGVRLREFLERLGVRPRCAGGREGMRTLGSGALVWTGVGRGGVATLGFGVGEGGGGLNSRRDGNGG